MTLALFTALAFATTFVGGWASEAMLSRLGMRRLFAIRAGILLAVAFTEILPEGLHLSRAAAGWSALLAFALLHAAGSIAMLDTCPEYLQECRVHYLPTPSYLTSAGGAALLALSLHSFLDGVNLAVSFGAGLPVGAAVGVAVVLHKVADGFTLSSLLRQSKTPQPRIWAVLALVAAATPLGCAVSALGFAGLPPQATAALLGVAAGSFVHIGATDILPLVHRRSDRASILYFSLAAAAVFLLHRGGHGHG
ncbi:MAG: ZIP family metal transporter [Elusimicrobia bacterium]|nr:ZIP family metal transporter [Elusimicrobiota bacterium]